MLITRISRRISNDTAGRPQRRRDFQHQHSLKPARCQRITVSGRTIASASYILGNSQQIPPNISLSIDANRSLLGLVRRSTLICCLSIKISASSVARDRRRSITIPKISLHKSNIEQQHRPILDQLPADWIYDRQDSTVTSTVDFDVSKLQPGQQTVVAAFLKVGLCAIATLWRDHRPSRPFAYLSPRF